MLAVLVELLLRYQGRVCGAEAGNDNIMRAYLMELLWLRGCIRGW